MSNNSQFLIIPSQGTRLMKHQKQEGIVQKGALSKAAGALARGAYGLVREHDKGPRTPLTPFFNKSPQGIRLRRRMANSASGDPRKPLMSSCQNALAL